MTGINHRRKNPVYRAPSSRSAKVAQLRRSHRAFQKKPFSPRKAVKEERIIQEVMGRRVFTGGEEVGSFRTGQRALVTSGSNGRRVEMTSAQSELETRSTRDDHHKRNDADMTVEQLLDKANLAGLPDRFRKHSDPAEERDPPPMADRDDDGDDDIFKEEKSSDAGFLFGSDEGGSQSSEAPLMVYPTHCESTAISSHVRQSESTDTPRAPEVMAATSQTHVQHLKIVPSALSPLNSEPWKEAGTLSSHSKGSAEDFDDPRERWSDAEEDARMLDCSDDGEEWRDELEEEDKAFEEGGVAAHGATSFNNAASPREVTGEAHEQPRLACDEVSRFFASTNADSADLTTDAPAGPKIQERASPNALWSLERSSLTATRAQPLNTTWMRSQSSERDSARDPPGEDVNLLLPDNQHGSAIIGARPGTPMYGHFLPNPGCSKQRHIILSLNSSRSLITGSRAAEHQARTLIERFSAVPARSDAESALCSPAAFIAWIPSIASRTSQQFDGPTSIYKWDVIAKEAKDGSDDTDIESFGSLHSDGRDIEAEAFEIVSDGMVGDSDDEGPRDGDDVDEATFEPRLIRDNRPKETWKISQWNVSKALSSEMERCQQKFHDDEQHLERQNDPKRRSARLALHASRADWPNLLKRNRNVPKPFLREDDNVLPRVTASPEEWDLSANSTQADLELLGEDGLPYLFEAVPDEVTAIPNNQLFVPVGVPGVEGDDDSGVLLALSPNPFLDHVDGTTSQDLDQSRLNLPSISDVIVVYNYPNDTGGATEAEARVGRRQKLRFTEAMILQDIRAYYEGLANALAANRKGDSV